MRSMIQLFIAGIAGLSLGLAPASAMAHCPPDSVPSGNICIDKYEVSVWETTNAKLIKKIKKGTVTLADLTAGAIQHGVSSDDYGSGCLDTGNGCVDFYAVSIPGVTPSAFLTWFQAAAMSRNAGKRLPTNGEWQAAALGTPDPGTDDDSTDCNVGSGTPNTTDPVPTGSRSDCISDVGAFDMVGNLNEWVADWVPKATNCLLDGSLFIGTGDSNCFGGADTVTGPAALIRGGGFSFFGGTSAGVSTVAASFVPIDADQGLGFRAAR
jgi:formylglycine-generating enzyme required for sulfatase activity